MKTFFVLISIVITSSAFSMDQCPIDIGQMDYLEKVGKMISEADSCYTASEVADACALGASGDVYTVGKAIERCERDMPVMSKKDSAMYSTLNGKCAEKYSEQDGTMYRSMEAFCHLQVTRLFLNILTREE